MLCLIVIKISTLKLLKKKEYGLKNNTTKKIQALFLKNQNKRFNHKI